MNTTVQLIYRGQTFEKTQVSFLNELTEQIKTDKLIYRGQIFEKAKRLYSSIIPVVTKTEKLIYRGQIVENYFLPLQPYHQPRALNWRYQVF